MQAPATPSLATPSPSAGWRAKTLLCLLLGLAAGCGQKGALTLPGAAKAAPANAASAPR